MGFSRVYNPVLHFDDINGRPLVGGSLYSFLAGTTTPATTYRDKNGHEANENPIPLNERGDCTVWIPDGIEYKFILLDSFGNVIWSADNVTTQGCGGSVEQVQSDWDEEDTTSMAFIKNKPNLSTVATSGSYNDLSNKPSIPAAQVNSDWNAQNGVAQILNKPNLSTVATSGSYNDLSNKPLFIALYGSTNYSAVEPRANSMAIICKKDTTDAVLIARDHISFTFAKPPDATGKVHIFTLHGIDGWSEAVYSLIDIFVATYNVTSYSDVEDAYFHNDQLVFCKRGGYLYPLKRNYSNKFIFEGTVDKEDGSFETITLDSSNAWTIETHSVDEYCVYRKSYDALHPLSTATTAADISNGYMDVEFDLGNADGFVIGDGNNLVFIGIPNKGGPSGVGFADAFTKIELYAINENDNPFLAAKVNDTSKDDYGDTLALSDPYMWNRTYSGDSISEHIVKKFRARYYLNMNTAWVPNLATKFYIYFTILL